MSSSIPLQLVDDDEFHGLEEAITAAEFSASSSKKSKTSNSQIHLSSSSPLCNLQTDGVPSGLAGGFKKFKDLSGAQAPNKLECRTENPTAESRPLYCTSEEKPCSNSTANIVSDAAEYLQSDSGNAHSSNRQVGSYCRVSNDCSNTVKVNACSSHRAPLREDCLRKCFSRRRLPAWPSSSGRCWHENSGPSRHSESRQTSRNRVDDERVLKVDPTDAICGDNSRLPWGLVPHTSKRIFPVLNSNSNKCMPKCKLPSFQFKGQIKYSDTVSDAESAANELLRHVEAKKFANGGSIPLGFDTEWKVVFKRGAQRRKVAVLQLCIDAEKCNVFHIIYSGIPSSLKSILEDPMVYKVGVGAYGDAEKLFTDYNVKVKGVKDLSGLANLKMVACGNKSWSLSSLAEELLGKQVDKTASIRMGDWEVERLSEAQLQYAATDAFASLYLFQVLVTFPDPQ